MNLLNVLVVGVLFILYVWTLYNIPILAVGVGRLRGSGRRGKGRLRLLRERLPAVSIIVPVKDEERVVNRLLEALLRLDYPLEKREVIIVEDGSSDRTVEICRDYVRRYPGQMRLVRRSVSDGKPSALNCALRYARGEIVGVFDADNVPEPDVLLRAVGYFDDPFVGAVQGRARAINARENRLTRFVSYEEAARYEAYIGGKDVLRLFVPLTGSCYFVRKSVVEEMGGWDGESLSEDTEMAARLLEGGYQTRFAPDVCSWQESPSDFRGLFKQRLRWFRGSMEVALRYGRLIVKKPGVVTVDAEMTLVGPYTLPLCLVSYAVAVHTLLVGAIFDPFFTLFLYGVSFLSLAFLFIVGLTLVYVDRPRKISNLLWLPFIYAYWGLQLVLSVLALFQILLRRQRRWLKTVKSGVS